MSFASVNSARIDRVDPQRIARPLRELAIAEHHQACERQALGAADIFAAHRIEEAPVRPGAGIEQHADDDEIERGAGALCGRRPRHRLVDLVPVVEAVDVEMPPARMERHVERGIGGPRRVDHELRGVVEPAEIDPKIRQPVAERQHLVRALAHGSGTEQRLRGGLVRHDQYFSSGLPDVLQILGLLRLRRVIAGGLLGLDLDMGVGRHQLVAGSARARRCRCPG